MQNGRWSWRGSHCDRWYVRLSVAIGGSTRTAAARLAATGYKGRAQAHGGGHREHVEVQVRLRSHRNRNRQRGLAVERVSSVEVLSATLCRHAAGQIPWHRAVVVDPAASGGQRVWGQAHARAGTDAQAHWRRRRGRAH